jgi:hypothetical protein
MAKRNGGIIGPSNVPSPFIAKGVWKLSDAFNYQKAGSWPIPLGYQIPNSARFNSASSDYLSRTPSTTNRRTFTWSFWFKRSVIGSGNECLVGVGTSGNEGGAHLLTDVLEVYNYNSGYSIQLVTTQVFRDPSAWYHLVMAFDTTQATDSNRVKIYVNGSQVTSFSTANYGSQNLDTNVNFATYDALVGNILSSGAFYNGYMSEINFIDGQQLTPSSFGQTDSVTGIWTPKAYTGTYGTNGYYLKFANSAALGTDSSGNGNTFTANNLTSIDQSYDSPTNNFSMLNPLANNEVPNTNTFSYTDGALTFKGSAGADTSQMMTVGTQAVSTGKWYWEAKLVSVGSDVPGIGILDTGANFNVQNAYPHNPAVSAYGYSYISNATKDNNGTSTAYGTSYTAGDIIGIALDMINNKLYFSKNGVFQNSGDPTSGATGTGAAFTVQSDLTYFPACNLRYSPAAGEWSFNFGYPAFTISSGNTDANGFGNFEYAVPSGYYALCTNNLATYG